MTPVLLAALVAILTLGALAVRSGRARALADLRAGWGQPVNRERKMEAIAASHRSRLSNIGGEGSLDARTWEDLDLDAVFAALDRTESTLGQHALYHRLRTAPVAPNLEAFEALVSRLEVDRKLRERAQTALARLKDPQGYDLWWLARQDAIETRPWYVGFPILAATTILLFILAPLFPQLTPALIGMLVANVAVRFLTMRRLGELAVAFRQIAPVVTTAESLRFLGGDDIRPLVGAIQADTHSLRGLKAIARWISGDPLMLPADAGPLAVMINDGISAAYAYVSIAFLLDGNGVYFGARSLRAHHTGLLRVTVAVGEVDAAISTASFRAGRRDWTRPGVRQPGGPADVGRVPASPSPGRGAEQHHTGSGTRRADYRLQHVREVDMSANDWRDGCDGANAPYLPGGGVLRTCVQHSQQYREIRRSCERQELLHRRGGVSSRAR